MYYTIHVKLKIEITDECNACTNGIWTNVTFVLMVELINGNPKQDTMTTQHFIIFADHDWTFRNLLFPIADG